MEEDDLIIQEGIHQTFKSGIFNCLVTEKMLAYVRLRMEGYSTPRAALLIGESHWRVMHWNKRLQKYFDFNPPAPTITKRRAVIYYLPCEICKMRVDLREYRDRVRCVKHKFPRIWIDSDTPAWHGRREYQKFIYHSRPERKKAQSAATVKWARKKRATDMEWVKKQREYHRKYNKSHYKKV